MQKKICRVMHAKSEELQVIQKSHISFSLPIACYYTHRLTNNETCEDKDIIIQKNVPRTQ